MTEKDLEKLALQLSWLYNTGTWEYRNIPMGLNPETLVKQGYLDYKGFNGSCDYYILSDKGRALVEFYSNKKPGMHPASVSGANAPIASRRLSHERL